MSLYLSTQAPLPKARSTLEERAEIESRALCHKLASEGHFDYALRLTTTLSHNISEIWHICMGLIQNGEYDRAIELSERLSNPAHKQSVRVCAINRLTSGFRPSLAQFAKAYGIIETLSEGKDKVDVKARILRTQQEREAWAKMLNLPPLSN